MVLLDVSHPDVPSVEEVLKIEHEIIAAHRSCADVILDRNDRVEFR